MTVFRTIKKIRDCDVCSGTGQVLTISGDPNSWGTCVICEGSGKVEVLSRVSRAVAARAHDAAKTLPPRERQEARELLKDHEPSIPTDDGTILPKPGGDSIVGEGFVVEE
jgi:hypothetical protein